MKSIKPLIFISLFVCPFTLFAETPEEKVNQLAVAQLNRDVKYSVTLSEQPIPCKEGRGYRVDLSSVV